jgi:hypothetical protein
MILLAFLIAVVASADRFTWETHTSRVVSRMKQGNWPRGAKTVGQQVFAVKHEGRLLVFDPNDSYGAANKAVAADPGDFAVLTMRHWSILRGILGRTSERWSLRIDQDGGSAFSPDDWREARSSVIKIVYGPDALAVPEFARLSNEDFAVTRMLWSGYIPNTMAVLLAAALAYSLRWVPPALETRRERRRAGILRAHRCPSCGYSTLGLRAPVCPECGDHLRVKRNDATAGS